MGTRRKSSGTPGAVSVDAFLRDLEHPHKQGIESLRRAILALDPAITEEIKWNAPSFRLADHFATFKLHPPKAIQLVLHVGAKPLRPVRRFELDLPPELLKWPAPDRCLITLADSCMAEKMRDKIVAGVRQWIRQLPRSHA